MGWRSRVDDIALTLFFACQRYFERPVPDAQLERLADLLHAYDRGTRSPLSSAERRALPLAIARQSLWSIGGWVVWLDDERAARRHAVATANELRWSRSVVDDLDRWSDRLS
jgi:homoserine kinase type II